jgi:heat shock protein HslJ
MKWNTITVILLLASIMLGACSTEPASVEPAAPVTIPPDPTVEPPADQPAGKLDGVIWRLVTFIDSKGNLVSVLPETRLTIEFNGEQASGSAGCNHYFASYQVQGERLSFSNAGMTEMFCPSPDGIMEQEMEYLAALQRVDHYRVVEDRLQMFDAQGQTVLTYNVEAPGSLQGTSWQMIGYHDGKSAFVSALAGTQVTAVFAPEGSLNGSAGCNQYTTSYQVEGDQLQLGDIASTRMFCEQPEGVMEQENAYLAALSLSASYRIQGEQLEIFDKTGMRLVSYQSAQQVIPGDTISTSNPLSADVLANMAYRSSWTASGEASLKNGEYSEPAAQDSAAEIHVMLSEHRADGVLEDASQAAAVILVTSTGGSGTFYDLALVLDLDGQPIHFASTFLGDRVQINSLDFEGGALLVDMVTQGPEDPFCCPTQHVLQRYVLEEGELKLESSEVLSEDAGEVLSGDTTETGLTGVEWQWVEYQEMDDSLLVVGNPQVYTLVFEPQGEVQIKADCNRVLGRYTMDGSQITIELGPSTLVACPPDSLSEQYLSLLSDVVSYVMRDGNLYLAVKYDSGIMKFTPDAP